MHRFISSMYQYVRRNLAWRIRACILLSNETVLVAKFDISIILIWHGTCLNDTGGRLSDVEAVSMGQGSSCL